MSNNLGDLATWITGIATIALFLIGYWQIKNERNSRNNANQEKFITEKRKQAEQIAIWIHKESWDNNHGPISWVAVRNQSFQPIYNLVIQGRRLDNDGVESSEPKPENQARIAVVPPGEGYISFPFDYHGMFHRSGVEAAFKDSLGVYWLRKTDGELIEIDSSPIQYYNIPLPIGWEENLLAAIPQNEDNE